MLQRTFSLAVLVSLASVASAQPAMIKTTYPFKAVGKITILADVYRSAGKASRPVLVWLHGGALIMGSRTSVPKNLLDLCADRDYILVSFDYRLAPEVKAPDIAADVKDAFAWLREQGPKLFHADPKKIVVTGGSAGGYLTMLSGTLIDPPPTALVAYWGYGDVDGDWYTKPSEHYRTKTPLVDKEDALQGVGHGVLTNTDDAKVQKGRGNYYRYLRQNGLWTREVTGFDPKTDKTKLDPLCPVRNITKNYPPILMIHGTEDTDVPYSLSADMAQALKRQGVTHELIAIEGAEHGLRDGDAKKVTDAHARALRFITNHLEK